MRTLVEVDRLVVRRADREVLHGVTFAVERSGFLAIVGPNGVGKTTLLVALLGLVRPAAGSIALAGRPLGAHTRRELARRMSYVPQSDGRAVPFTVQEFVLLGRYAHRGRFAPADREDRHIVRDALEHTGTAAFAERPVSSLSGGERQRVLIAGALAQQAEVLLLDEPTAFLDPRHQLDTAALLRDLNRSHGLTVLMVTHDFNLAAACGHNVLALREGRVVYHGDAETFLTSQVLEEVYGVPFDVLRRPAGGAWAAVGGPQ
ncbi:MAG TPA: ABC transporter ATP-binding protein [Vicinamibacterales bacterium]|nr:ABC transporter ATP-binding protein [Vicinamibacterales bacterium]